MKSLFKKPLTIAKSEYSRRLISSVYPTKNRGQRIFSCLSTVGLTAVLFGLSSPAQAGIIRNFTSRFSKNDTGDIQIVGNTLLTCPTSASGCTNAQNGTATGTAANNNNFNMVRVDVDSDTTTFNSSRATFNLPAGATVLWAGLYWGGDTTAGTNGAAAPTAAQRNIVRFATPATASYTNITAAQVDVDTSNGSDYQGFADVTSLVQAGGSGTYTVANVQTGIGVDRQGGWALVVVYRDATQSARNLTVFDGFAVVDTTTPNVNFTVNGFTTPPNGPVTARIGAVAYEGDLGSTGDNLNFNGTNLTDALNPTGNFFNSSITRLGSNLTNKNPNYINQLGFDIDIVALNNPNNGVLGNNATSANINLTTSSEFYQPGVITTAIDIFAPAVAGNVNKSVSDLNGGTVLPGDILEYTVSVANTGQDGALNNVLTDPIPANTAYIPNSLQITAGANTGAKTDSAGNDQAEYDSTNNRVVFRLGTGATGTAGGTLSPGDSTTLKFRVQVNGSTPNGTTVSNQAAVDYTAQTLGTNFTAQSDGDSATSGVQPTNVVVTLPDLTIAKSHTGNFTQGQTGTYTITATNSGTGTTSGTVTVSDTLPAGLTPTAASGTGWTCNISGQTVTCTRSDALAAGSNYPPLSLTVNVASNAPASVTNTVTVSGGAQINTSNDSANDPTTINPAADISLTKTHTGNFTVGQNGTYTLTVTNNGASTAAGPLTVTDTLPTGLTFVSGSTGWSCTASGQTVTCTNPNSLASGATSTVTLTVAVGPQAAPSVTNTASASSTTSDPTPSNNTASDPTTVRASADLSLTKTTNNPTPKLGDSITYTVTLTNSGLSTATNVQVRDQMPAGITFGSATTSAGTTYNSSTGVWSVPSLANGTSVTLQMTGTVNSAGTITNTAEVTASDQFDPDSTPNNNVASEDDQASVTTPTVAADLSITKTDGKTTITAGSPTTYTIVVTNNGPSNVTSATVSDTVPSSITGVTWTCTASSGSSCGSASGSGSAINTTVNLLNGGTATYTVRGTVSSTATGTIQNTAAVTVPTGVTDTLNTNNSATDTTDAIKDPSRVRLVKRITAINSVNLTSLVDDPNDANDNASVNWPSGYLRGASAQVAQPGDVVEYTIYFLSDGGNDATNVKICDLVPANTTFLSTAFNGSSPTDGGLPTDLGIALASGSTTPTAYLTNVADAPDRGQLFAAGTSAPAVCNPPAFTTPVAASSNLSGAVVVDVVTNPTILPKSTAPGTPSSSYGFVRFRVKVN